MEQNPLRNLPSVNDILQTPLAQLLERTHDREILVDAIRKEIDSIRVRLQTGEALNGAMGADQFAGRVERRLQWELRPKLRRVINATGIILHTNLGRAPLAAEAAQRARFCP